MDSERLELICELEKIRGRPLITYVTSIRSGVNAKMGTDIIPLFIKQIDKIKGSSDKVDLLIISNGGDPLVAWRIITLLKTQFKKVSVLVPYIAYSAATLLALGADEIIMHPYGNLGPLDIQLTLNDAKGNMITVSYEDIIKFIEFVKDIGINDQELIEKMMEKLTDEFSPTALGYAKRGSQLGLTMSEKLLSLHLKDANKAKTIAETLNKKFYHHGYPLGIKEAKEIGLPIAKKNEKVEEIIWNIYESYAEELKFNELFNINDEIINEIGKKELTLEALCNLKTEQKLAYIETQLMSCYVEQQISVNYIVAKDLSFNFNIVGNTILYKSMEVK